MRLVDLHPRYENEYLIFDCPTCTIPNPDPLRCDCGIAIPVGSQPNAWKKTGVDFETLTIHPSIWHHCPSDPHFFITNGEIVFA